MHPDWRGCERLLDRDVLAVGGKADKEVIAVGVRSARGYGAEVRQQPVTGRRQQVPSHVLVRVGVDVGQMASVRAPVVCPRSKSPVAPCTHERRRARRHVEDVQRACGALVATRRDDVGQPRRADEPEVTAAAELAAVGRVADVRDVAHDDPRHIAQVDEHELVAGGGRCRAGGGYRWDGARDRSRPPRLAAAYIGIAAPGIPCGPCRGRMRRNSIPPTGVRDP